MRALVIDDDTLLAEVLAVLLRGTGADVDMAADLSSARRAVAETRYDLIVLDVYLPDGNGLDLAAEIRAAHSMVPILVLTAESADSVAVLALDAGVDDFVVKPVSPELFLARARALLRRCGADHGDVLLAGNLHFHRLSRLVLVGGQPVRLTLRELGLLEHLLLNRGEFCGRTEMLRQVFGYTFEPGTNILEVNVRRVRVKLARAGWDSKIESRRGRGYRIEGSASAPAPNDRSDAD